jgi:tagatose-6-phosphate ketose/aldose isomerase
LVEGQVNEGLRALIGASENEKDARGIRYTPHEILRQPSTWQRTYKICAEQRPGLSQFFRTAGIGAAQASRPTVFLVGAGTSDYVGRALRPLLHRLWGCEVSAAPSTDLLMNLGDLVFADRSYLWVSFSRSGDSSVRVGCTGVRNRKISQRAASRGDLQQTRPGAAVCRTKPDSASLLALDDSANDRGPAMTSSYTDMVVAGHCLAPGRPNI